MFFSQVILSIPYLFGPPKSLTVLFYISGLNFFLFLGIQGYKTVHLQKAVEFLSKTVDKYPYESLISSPFPLQDFHSAVNLARTKKYYRTAVRPQFTPNVTAV